MTAFFIIMAISAALSFLVTALLLRSPLATHFGSSKVHPASNGSSAPQLGGLAFVPVALIIAGAALLIETGTLSQPVLAILIAMAALFVLGIIDDRHHLPPLFRLVFQLIVSGAFILASLPSDEILMNNIPFWTSAAPIYLITCLLFMTWTINAVNFMDGADWALFANLMPGLLAVCIVAVGKISPENQFPILAAITGGFAAFGYFNRPLAKIYLGDGGSLPLGFFAALTGVAGLAISGSIAGFLCFAYLYFDTGMTFLDRLFRHEQIIRSHNGHAYQAARPVLSDSGLAMRMGAVSIINSVVALTAFYAGNSISVQFSAFCICVILSAIAYFSFRRLGADKPSTKQ